MTHLVQVLLPLDDNSGNRFPPAAFDDVKRELSDRFGGVTAFMQASAEGVWADGGEQERDRVVIFEVMADDFEGGWWKRYRKALELRFAQDVIIVRSWPITLV